MISQYSKGDFRLNRYDMTLVNLTGNDIKIIWIKSYIPGLYLTYGTKRKNITIEKDTIYLHPEPLRDGDILAIQLPSGELKETDPISIKSSRGGVGFVYNGDNYKIPPIYSYANPRDLTRRNQ